jgi:hypothetical protein
MRSSPLPQWHSPTKSVHGRILLNSIPVIGISIGTFLMVGLILYMTFLSPYGDLLCLSTSKWSIVSIPSNNASSPTPDDAPSSPSDVLSLEHIRDIVAPTRGFFSRDYSLYLGWNNVSIRSNLSVIKAKLIIPK